jgi:hypothetical protein
MRMGRIRPEYSRWSPQVLSCMKPKGKDAEVAPLVAVFQYDRQLRIIVGKVQA